MNVAPLPSYLLDRNDPANQNQTSPTAGGEKSVMSAVDQLILAADSQRMAPLFPINAAQTLVGATAGVNAQMWLSKFMADRQIINQDYCVR
jgi:hypothetical protein